MSTKSTSGTGLEPRCRPIGSSAYRLNVVDIDMDRPSRLRASKANPCSLVHTKLGVIVMTDGEVARSSTARAYLVLLVGAAFALGPLIQPALADTSLQAHPVSDSVGKVRPPPQAAQAAPGSVVDPRVDSLQRRIQEINSQMSWVFPLMTVLIAVLALGGTIGVVFSIRDQRRVSQLHELSVAGEQASQRRSEDSYTTFIDASQKTLALVNDTLQLAKEATAKANETMTLRTERNLTAITDQAQDLLDRVINEDDFKRIVLDAKLRSNLESLAKELSAIEGYLSLQAIQLRPECLFVQGMSRHLQNDARGAFQYLRRVGQEGASKDLRALAQYWIAYLHNNQGDYRQAAEVFRAAQLNLSSGSPRYFELERIAWETEFFLAASRCKRDATTPERKNAVLGVLEQLEKVGHVAGNNLARHAKVSQRIANTRANILMWAAGVQRRRADQPDADGDACLTAAQELYAAAGTEMFPKFGVHECKYYLTGEVDKEVYAQIEREAMHFLRLRREPRNTANLQESILIALYRQRSNDPNVSDALREGYAKVQTAIGDISDEECTIFSQFEKRNISRHEFATEVKEFYDGCSRTLRVSEVTTVRPVARAEA
jgi:TolA-binding protein